MGKTEIYYFSGTGNSLQTARELQKRLPECVLVPMVSLLNNDVIKTSGEIVGFVFPLHAFSLPLPVKDFLEKVDVSSASYIFAVVTRTGSACKVFQEAARLLSKKGKTLDTRFFINMPSNYLLMFPISSQEEIAKADAEMFDRVDGIAKVIRDRESCHEKDTHSNFFEENILFPVLSFFIHKTRYFNMESAFYADSRCAGCGTCERVCLSGKIKMNDGLPLWEKEVNCFFCFACIHCCPVRAVQMRMWKTAGKGRYIHPGITADDIARQKGGC